MRRLFARHAGLVAALWGALCLWGCQRDDPGAAAHVPDYLIQVGESGLTTREYVGRLELAKAVYDEELESSPELLHRIKLNLIGQLTEELVIRERARELDITVTAEELERAMVYHLGDYPKDLVKSELINQAIVLEDWKSALKNRLLMEKVVREDLEKELVFEAADVLRLNGEKIVPGGGATPEVLSGDEGDDVMNAVRLKAANSYQKWLAGLQKRYTVTINQAIWKELIPES